MHFRKEAPAFLRNHSEKENFISAGNLNMTVSRNAVEVLQHHLLEVRYL